MGEIVLVLGFGKEEKTMTKKRMTAREELMEKLVNSLFKAGANFTDILSGYYIQRKKPLTQPETPSQRARRTTLPLKGMDDD